MPYRKLPTTDITRIKALQQAVSMEGYKERGQLVLSYQTIRDAQEMLNKFRRIQRQCQQYRDMYAEMNKQFKDETAVARMYVTHFIQVLLMAIQRGELRSEVKAGYGLDLQRNYVPSLLTNDDIVTWGKKIIDGEEERVRKGGAPIYNPTIAMVKVHYSVFTDHYYNVTNLKQSAEKYRKELVQLRPMVDDLLQDLWNQVEAFYANEPLSVRIYRSKSFGLIYYTRDSEKRQIEAEKKQLHLEF